jgi:FeS assembly SUF system protein
MENNEQNSNQNNNISREELRDKVIEALMDVYDPEIPVNVYDLGLIYDIEITAENDVVVLMTLTAPNCPEAGGIPIEVEENVRMIPEVKNVKVFLTFDPPWDKSRLSEVAKIQLGFF